MTESPEISICMPCFNSEQFLDETLNSFINQTFKNFEVIIVNDASTDKSFEILEGYAKLDKRIKVFNHSKNKGAAAARNLAFSNSKGNFIIFFDSDDIVNKSYLQNQLALAKTYCNVIIACELQEFYNNNLNDTGPNLMAVRETLEPVDWLLNNNAKGLNLTQCGMFCIPRRLIEKAGLWNESLSLIDDFEFFPRLLLEAEKIIYNSSSVIYYRRSLRSSLSSSSGTKALKSAFKAIMLTSNLIIEKEDSIRSKNAISNYWRGWIYHAYGYDKDLYQSGRIFYKRLTGQSYIPKNAGITGVLDRFLGWKFTKKLKDFARKI